MNENKFYYNEDSPFILSNRDKKIKIEKGTHWEILKENQKTSHVVVSKKDKLPIIVVLDSNSIDELKNMSLSTHKSYTKKHLNYNQKETQEISQKEFIEKEYSEIMLDMKTWTENLLKTISKRNISIAANVEEILLEINSYRKKASNVLEPENSDFYGSQLVKSTKKILEDRKALKEEPVLNLDSWNHGLRSMDFKYIPVLEQLIKSQLKESINFFGDKKYDLADLRLSDNEDYLKILRDIYNGDLKKAYEGTNLDTAAREELPDKFWDDFVYNSSVQEASKKEKKHKEAINIEKIKLEKETIDKNVSNKPKKTSPSL